MNGMSFHFYLKQKIQKSNSIGENSEFKWIKPNEIKNYETVPELEKNTIQFVVIFFSSFS